MHPRARYLIDTLQLAPHPEGGFYRRVFESRLVGAAGRPQSSAILFLLPAGTVSRWHCVDADELWHFHEGAPLELLIAEQPDAAVRRYTGSDRKPLGRRLSTDFMETEAFRTGGRRVVASREPQEIAPGVWTTGEVPRANDFEDVGGPFFLDEALTRPDPILDDQTVFFTGREGTMVVLGCAHAGVVNTLEHIRTLTHGAPLHTVVGGMHLERASERRMTETFAALRRLGVQRFGPNHCTGIAAIARFWHEFPGRCVQASAGVRLQFA